jgi:leucyl/phenylalanyl-tRNA--protein transferase
MLLFAPTRRWYGGYGHAVPPVEPPPSRWTFGDPAGFDPYDDLVGIGADLAPGTLLAAYRRGLFPMPSGTPGDLAKNPVHWFCPVRRGVLPLDGLVVSKSLRRSCRDLEIRVDTAFAEVIEACGDPRRPQGWIDRDVRSAYLQLHELGWAHSVETWRDGRLVGGLYGVGIGGLFAGESMFHRERDASKVALVGLVERLRESYPEQRLLDVQWSTPHLESLGVVEVGRDVYLRRLARALQVREPAAFGEG